MCHHTKKNKVPKNKIYLRRQRTCTLKTMRYWWKKSKMTQTDGKIYHVLELVESIVSKWLYYPRQCTDLMQSLSNYHWNLYRTRTKTQKFVQKHERLRIARAIPRKKNNAGAIRLPGFRLDYKAIVIKRVWYWHQKKENHQKYISMGQVREFRNKPIHLWLINLWPKRQEYTMVKR